MAKLEYKGKTYADHDEIRAVLADHGVPYERWGLRSDAQGSPEDRVLAIYKPEIDRLMRERAYQTVDLVALKPTTPNLDAILAKFAPEHHHVDDEVRFTVEGEGVFEIADDQNEMLKFTAEPGDLIVIPALRRHAFFLTNKRNIRCIRLFKTPAGWEAIYPRVSTL
jgi:1,2-dihydroxy-3-keto-5-methylthiopentene dioxygenase